MVYVLDVVVELCVLYCDDDKFVLFVFKLFVFVDDTFDVYLYAYVLLMRDISCVQSHMCEIGVCVSDVIWFGIQ